MLLVNLDLRRPAIHRYLELGESPGISQYLESDWDLSDVFVNPGIDRLVKLVEELKTRYQNRLVLFDLPPLLATDDVIAFAPHVDTVMLVLEEGEPRKKDGLRRAYELLSTTDCIGTVLNKSGEDGSTYGYGYY